MKEILLTDMSACVPATALGRDQSPNRWFLVDYTSEGGVSGTMMFSEPEKNAPEVVLPLRAAGTPLAGKYHVYVGVNYTRTPLSSGGEELAKGSVRLRLTDDRAFTVVGAEHLGKGAPGHYENKMGRLKETWNSVYEVYWKSTELSGQDLHIVPVMPDSPHDPCMANIAWIRLVEMSDEEVQDAEQDLPTDETKRLAACFCFGQLTRSTSGTTGYHPTDVRYIRELIEPFRDSDFRLILIECIRGGMCAYKTTIGSFGEPGQAWDPDWVDPLAEAIAWSRDCGCSPYVSMRMVGSGYPVKRSVLQKNSFYYANRQYAIEDEAGEYTSNLSLAYPEIRSHWISFLREALGYGADGVHLCLNRNDPFVLYEPPVLESFRESCGEDPRDLPYDEPRWLKHRCGFVNQYFREIRRMLDEEGTRAGKKLGFAVTFFHQPSPQYYAMDPQTWVDEGLVDYLMPHTLLLTNPKAVESLEPLVEITRGTEVELWPDIFPRTPSGRAYAEKLKDFYEAGADGFSFWGAEGRATRLSEWNVVKRLGHRDRMDRYADLADAYYRRCPLHTIDGVSTRYSHTDG